MNPPDPNDLPAFLARHGAMRVVGVFTASPDFGLRRGDAVVLKTDRGIEAGEVLCPATPQATLALSSVSRGTVLRPVGPDDRKRIADLADIVKREFAKAEELVRFHRLSMKFVDLEHLLGGERIVGYFLSESRVDFRELVKSMAREFKARIELRQVGVRDEAKLLADYGDCGKPVCCTTHMAVMPPVSMRMAKLQKSTLDPTKISGRCGRLKCCLRFEQDVYEEHLAEVPPGGCRVVTTTGQGKVLAQEILARRLLIEFEDGRRLPVPAADILTRL